MRSVDTKRSSPRASTGVIYHYSVRGLLRGQELNARAIGLYYKR